MYRGPKLGGSYLDLNLALDAGTHKGAGNNLIDPSTWTAAGTDATGFSRNGSSSENYILDASSGPQLEIGLVWETRASGDGNADGGWNGSYFSADHTKLYRASIWVRRTSSTSGGTFYLGTNGSPSAVLQLNNGASQGNPYWDCVGTSALSQNKWYLVVGHIFPSNHTGTSKHPDSGRWSVGLDDRPVFESDHNGCNVGPDMKMSTGTTSLRHRAYHYYCSDSTTRLQFAYPRFDLCDGSEPSLDELIRSTNPAIDTSSTNAKCVLSGAVVKNGHFYFRGQGEVDGDPYGDHITIPESLTKVQDHDDGITYEFWMNPDVNERRSLFFGAGTIRHIEAYCGSSGGYFRTEAANQNGYSFGTSAPSGGLPINTWTHIAIAWDPEGSTRAVKWYKNGSLFHTHSNFYSGTAGTGEDFYFHAIGRATGTPTYNYAKSWSGYLNGINIYKRTLSASEVLRSYNSTKTRYGV